ncbi:hypothetical protein SOVF_178440 [Spinacia oleracea]|nr:hypothetical protein SOVF_178440 [Spinacia oleracea]
MPGLLAAPTTPQTQTYLHPRLANASDSIRYPLASTGRGLLPAPRGILPDPVASSIAPNSWALQQYQHQHHHSRLSAPSSHLVRGPFLHPSQAHISPVSFSAAARGVLFNNRPQTMVGSSPYSAPDSNDPKDPIDKGTDDTLVTLRDRKVRISDGASLYALCRSWLRNGCVEDNQPQYGDVLKSHPKPFHLPLPLPPHEYSSPKRKERDDETEVDEDENLVDISNAQELLTSHVKQAKRVRARLREERSQRIERYKSRLALLLTPNGDVQNQQE